AGSRRLCHGRRGRWRRTKGLAMTITLWHNPRCSKSREALALLEERGADVTLRLYQQDTPSETEIRALPAHRGVKPAGIMRTKDAAFKALDLTGDESDSALIRAMADNPALIERPIAISGSRAIIGRPPANVLALL